MPPASSFGNSLSLLVVGSGGREHALAWKLSKSDSVKKIFCAPGNGGTAHEGKTKNVSIESSDFQQLGEFCLKEKIDLVVVGPDNPLADGLVDFLENLGVRVFGPTRQQAKLEWSKAYAKEIMGKLGLPTARYAICHSYEEGARAIEQNDWARVVKADGLALGKGVFVCNSQEEALAALSLIFKEKRFGVAGETVVIEERLEGEELSLIMLADGKHLVVLEPSQDHKRRFDNDRGPNTGGMGAYSPVDLYTRLRDDIQEQIVDPLAAALAKGDLDFKGVLYAGILVTTVDSSHLKPFVLEFNARFGDPETQALLPRMSSDLLPALWACTEGNLDAVPIQWSNDTCCCVVAVTESYPQASSRDKPLSFEPLPDGCMVFHAGTKVEQGAVLTNGGRVLSVVGLAPSMEAAAALCYRGLKSVSFEGMDYRKDIARRAFKQCLSG